MPTAEGARALRLTVTRTGGRIIATLAGEPVALWRLQLAGVSSVRTAQPETSHAVGVILTAPAGISRMVAELL